MKVRDVSGQPAIVADGQLASSEGILYTAPRAVRITFFRVVAGASSQAVTIYVRSNGSSTSRKVLSSTLAASGDKLSVLDPGEILCLQAGDVIRGFSTTAAVNDFTISGY